MALVIFCDLLDLCGQQKINYFMGKTGFDICLCPSFLFLEDLDALDTKVKAVWMRVSLPY